jgi:hypothetical protein
LLVDDVDRHAVASQLAEGGGDRRVTPGPVGYDYDPKAIGKIRICKADIDP